MTSGTSTPSGTTVTVVGQWATSRRISLKERVRACTAKASTWVKVRVSTRAPTKATASVSTRLKARALGGTRASGYEGTCHYCGEVVHKRAECWKYWKDL